MRKFFPSFVLAFILAVSFLVPVGEGVFAISNLGNLRAKIISVSGTHLQTSNYSYVCPKVALAQLSFFNRLLAAIGMTRSLPAEKLAESTIVCGEPGLVKKSIQAKWTCTPTRFRDISGDYTVECQKDVSSKTETKTFSKARATTYGVTSCTTIHIYSNLIGAITNSCQGPKAQPPSTVKVNYPPDIDVNGIGFTRGRFLVGTNLKDDFNLNESSETVLAVYDVKGDKWDDSKFLVPIKVALTQLVFNTKTNEFDHVAVPCTSITVAGQALDKNCQTIIKMGTGSVDVTPKAPVPYYTYSVFVSGAITEK